MERQAEPCLDNKATKNTTHTHTLWKNNGVCIYYDYIYIYIYIWYMIYNWNPGKKYHHFTLSQALLLSSFLVHTTLRLKYHRSCFLTTKKDIAPRQNLGLDIVCVNNCTHLWLCAPNTSRIYMFELFWLNKWNKSCWIPQTFCSTSPSGPPKLRVRCTDVRPEEHNVRNKNLQVESTFQKVFTSAMNCKSPTKN